MKKCDYCDGRSVQCPHCNETGVTPDLRHFVHDEVVVDPAEASAFVPEYARRLRAMAKTADWKPATWKAADWKRQPATARVGRTFWVDPAEIAARVARMLPPERAAYEAEPNPRRKFAVAFDACMALAEELGVKPWRGRGDPRQVSAVSREIRAAYHAREVKRAQLAQRETLERALNGPPFVAPTCPDCGARDGEIHAGRCYRDPSQAFSAPSRDRPLSNDEFLDRFAPRQRFTGPPGNFDGFADDGVTWAGEVPTQTQGAPACSNPPPSSSLESSSGSSSRWPSTTDVLVPQQGALACFGPPSSSSAASPSASYSSSSSPTSSVVPEALATERVERCLDADEGEAMHPALMGHVGGYLGLRFFACRDIEAACERARDAVRRGLREWPYGKTCEWQGDGKGNVVCRLVSDEGVRK